MGGLDTLSNGFQSETLSELHNCLAQPCVHPVNVTITDVAAIDLEFAKRELAQTRKRRIACTEIVERQRAVECSQAVGDVVRNLEILDDLVFGDLHDQPRPVFG